MNNLLTTWPRGLSTIFMVAMITWSMFNTCPCGIVQSLGDTSA